MKGRSRDRTGPASLAPTGTLAKWSYFLIWVLVNFLVGCTDLPLRAQWTVLLLGAALPLYLALRSVPEAGKGEKPPTSLALFGRPPALLLALGLFFALYLRLDRIDSLFRWPNLDEGWNGTAALELSRHWTWRFFYTFGQAPPLPVWCSAWLLRMGFPALFSLWVPSALVSLLTLVSAHLAARKFFSPSFAWTLTGLFAFSYWPLFIGRFCHQGAWLPLWACLCFWVWGLYSGAEKKSDRPFLACLLGLVLGAGSFTFTPWPAVAGALFALFSWRMVRGPRKDKAGWFWMAGAFLLALVPFLHAVLTEGFGGHILSLSPWGGWFHGLHLFGNLFRYLAVLLWGSYEADPAYTPLQGGFLHPLLGALFLLGLVECFRWRRSGLFLSAGSLFFLFLVPGILSPNLESFRIAQVLPLLLFLTALGLFSLLGTVPPTYRGLLLALLLILTGLWDYQRLCAPYSNPDRRPADFGRPLKSIERYRAWRILNDYQKANGPGYVLADLDPGSFNDPTLSLLSAPFNKAQGLSIPSGRQQWLALFVNIHYRPFLEKFLPDGRWTWVAEDLHLDDGGNMLGIIPITASNQKVLYSWLQPHTLLAAVDRQRFSQAREDYPALLKTLDSGRGLFQGDPFLESVFWSKRAWLEYKKLDYQEQLLSYQNAIALGYPTGELFWQLGQLLAVGGRDAQAAEAFRKAQAAPFNRTPSRAAEDWVRDHPSNASAP